MTRVAEQVLRLKLDWHILQSMFCIADIKKHVKMEAEEIQQINYSTARQDVKPGLSL
jgi:hypothetical protein